MFNIVTLECHKTILETFPVFKHICNTYIKLRAFSYALTNFLLQKYVLSLSRMIEQVLTEID